MKKHWPPQPIEPDAILPEDYDALDVRLETMARSIASALDFDTEQRRRENLDTTTDTHLIAPPSWPTHGCLANWITCIQQARALLKVLPELR